MREHWVALMTHPAPADDLGGPGVEEDSEVVGKEKDAAVWTCLVDKGVGVILELVIGVLE